MKTNSRGMKPELMRTMRGDLANTTPRRQLLDDNRGEICYCTGVRCAAIRCLERLKDSSDSPEIIKKKRECAREVITDVLSLSSLF